MRGNLPMLVSFIMMKKSSHLFYFTGQKEIKQRREGNEEDGKVTGKGNAISKSASLFSLGQALGLRFLVGHCGSCHGAPRRCSAYSYVCNKHAPGKKKAKAEA